MVSNPTAESERNHTLAPGRLRLGVVHRLTLLAGVILVAQFQLLRALLLWSNRDLAGDASWQNLASAFLVGIRFDLAVAAYFLLVLLPLLWLCHTVWGHVAVRRVYLAVTSLTLAGFTMAGIAETEFYREFFVRFNSLALQYWQQPATVLSMIWHGYPVVRYLLLALLLLVPCIFALWAFSRKQPDDVRWSRRRKVAWELSISAATVLVLVVAARGGLRGTPLNWGDSVHCDSVFANHLAQNGVWSLAKSAQQMIKSDNPLPKIWPHPLPNAVASQRLRGLMASPGGKWLGSPDYPVLRSEKSSTPATEHSAGVSPDAPNIVVIIMESFSARFCGACGADQSDDGQTPQFDRLARNGVLFDRCFSAGTHTHQANFAVVCGVPNLPGHEGLMNDLTLGGQPLDSLPRALKRRGYQTMYLYNGDLAWENMRGFFRVQGIDRFIDRADFDPDSQQDSTWGVTDGELFKRANAEFARAKRPFFATICTLSNHEPFDLPRPLPFPEIVDQGSMNDHLNGIRYADWAIGQFFKMAQDESYFDNTLFVLVGDHGFSVAPILTDLRLLRYHVPLLFYAPKLLTGGARQDHRVASQLDIMPTVLAMIGEDEPHQYWGKNLFALAEKDAGWAYFKPSEFGEQVGFAQGNLVLVKAGGGKTILYRYDLGHPPQVTQLAESLEQLQSMDELLQAYVQTAAQALEHRRMLATDRDVTIHNIARKTTLPAVAHASR